MQAGRPRSVLLVEDEDLVALAAEEALQDHGFRVCGTAATEGAALELAARHAPDFAVVDLHLGQGGSGLKVGRALAAVGVQVLYATGHGLAWRQEMEDTGARGCLTKPYQPDEVPRALEALGRLQDGGAPRHLPREMHLFVD
ncbi:response regulator [Falsiroseomonas selenitidurans]|uniref:Response regulator n=1 Tax=Falsiroseomonas selenitidurans TaxID=2716335 RepID=A0ABX1E468_9PROT|nr:response regulator [Falsiroseomonas selenitidurans]NKC31985.1 response regulator [Falsiroseomonas selenitidurans]